MLYALNVCDVASGYSLPSACFFKWNRSSSDMWENLQLGPKSQIPKIIVKRKEKPGKVIIKKGYVI